MILLRYFVVIALRIKLLIALLLSGCASISVPYIEKVEIAEGVWVDVEVYTNTCFIRGETFAYSSIYPKRAVYLCGYPHTKHHELAHHKGMKHTKWTFGIDSACATILASGYKTNYIVGSTLCTRNGYEWVDHEF